jgi:ArsR family transcriptional regulator
MRSDVEDTTRLFKALSDETRIRIIKLLQHRDRLCVCEIMQALDITQTRASRNLGILRSAGLVTSRKSGLWVEYSLKSKGSGGRNPSILRLLKNWLEDSPVVVEDRERLANSCRVGPRAVGKCR